MTTIRTMLCALALTGCYQVAPAPSDGGSAEVDAATVEINDACLYLEQAAPTGCPIDEHGNAVPFVCPWPAQPTHVCEPAAAQPCFDAVEAAETCEELEAALAGCDPEACR